MLAGAGQIEEALDWLRRTSETAPPAVVEKAAGWLASADAPAFRNRGVQALRAGTIPVAPRKNT